ncbi:MAG: caspase family protein [Desulfuromonadaceae bacterium]|nr:caspase family protein [Desulfuromonadaceae bacterium]
MKKLLHVALSGVFMLVAFGCAGVQMNEEVATLLKDVARNDDEPLVRAFASLAYLGGKVAAAQPATETAQAQVDAAPASAALAVARKWDFPAAVQQRPDAVAVVIGNRDYQSRGKGVPNVDFAHNDANAIRSYVVDSLGYRAGNILDLRDASQAEMIAVFGSATNPRGKLYNWVRPGESEVFVYYSGHGAPGLNDGKGYLLPVDADPAAVELNGYPLEALYQNLARLPVENVTLILDACFSGDSGAGPLVKSASSISLRVVEPRQVLPAGTVLSAAGPAEVASWDATTGHGLFTRHFLEGVTGAADTQRFGNRDGQVTLGELKAYLTTEVGYQARRQFGREQHPVIRGTDDQVLTVLH